MQVLGDDHVADLAQWVVESSSAGESEATSKRFATANTMLTAVPPPSLYSPLTRLCIPTRQAVRFMYLPPSA